MTEGDTRGFLKLVRHKGHVLGVTIDGVHAGELLLPWAQIITGKASAFALGSAIIAYPTRSEISKAGAFAEYSPMVFGKWPKRWAATVARTAGGSHEPCQDDASRPVSVPRRSAAAASREIRRCTRRVYRLVC